MNAKVVPVLLVLYIVSLVGLASCVSAEEHAILSGDSYSIEVELSFGDSLEYSWTSDAVLDFTIEDPSGSIYASVADTDGLSSFILAFSSGTYTLTWSNEGISVAHLSFDVSGSFNEVEEAVSMMVWGAVIIGIVIFAVVVIIVIVVVMGGRRAPAQPAMGPSPQMASQALATGMCPTCGSPLDPNASFCSRCGTRYR